MLIVASTRSVKWLTLWHESNTLERICFLCCCCFSSFVALLCSSAVFCIFFVLLFLFHLVSKSNKYLLAAYCTHSMHDDSNIKTHVNGFSFMHMHSTLFTLTLGKRMNFFIFLSSSLLLLLSFLGICKLSLWIVIHSTFWLHSIFQCRQMHTGTTDDNKKNCIYARTKRTPSKYCGEHIFKHFQKHVTTHRCVFILLWLYTLIGINKQQIVFIEMVHSDFAHKRISRSQCENRNLWTTNKNTQ